MDGSEFDALVARAARVISRRRFGAAAGGVLAGLAGANVIDAKPRKKKKKPTCKRPKTKCGRKGCCRSNQLCFERACLPVCQFTRTATRWTLQGDCTTITTIEVPDGVTLDGNGKTISAAGPPNPLNPYVLYDTDRFWSAVVLVRSGTGNVENLTIRGDQLYRDADMAGVAVHQATSRIANVTVENSNLPGELGMRFSGAGTTADVQQCSIGNMQSAIEVYGGAGDPVRVDLDEITISSVEFGQIFFDRARGSITRSSLRDSSHPIHIRNNSVVTIADNDIRPGIRGIDVIGSTVDLTGNEIVRTGDHVSVLEYGIWYDEDSAGTVVNNSISGFLTPGGPFGSFHDSSGIRLTRGSAVTLSGNTFPPPGNLHPDYEVDPVVDP